MGIDIPDIRYVIHFKPPDSIIDYYQQIGRGGRDGLITKCILLYSNLELENNIKQIENNKPSFADLHNLLSIAKIGVVRNKRAEQYKTRIDKLAKDKAKQDLIRHNNKDKDLKHHTSKPKIDKTRLIDKNLMIRLLHFNKYYAENLFNFLISNGYLITKLGRSFRNYSFDVPKDIELRIGSINELLNEVTNHKLEKAIQMQELVNQDMSWKYISECLEGIVKPDVVYEKPVWFPFNPLTTIYKSKRFFEYYKPTIYMKRTDEGTFQNGYTLAPKDLISAIGIPYKYLLEINIRLKDIKEVAFTDKYIVSLWQPILIKMQEKQTMFDSILFNPYDKFSIKSARYLSAKYNITDCFPIPKIKKVVEDANIRKLLKSQTSRNLLIIDYQWLDSYTRGLKPLMYEINNILNEDEFIKKHYCRVIPITYCRKLRLREHYYNQHNTRAIQTKAIMNYLFLSSGYNSSIENNYIFFILNFFSKFSKFKYKRVPITSQEMESWWPSNEYEKKAIKLLVNLGVLKVSNYLPAVFSKNNIGLSRKYSLDLEAIDKFNSQINLNNNNELTHKVIINQYFTYICILELIRNGVSKSAIARKININANRISEWLRKDNPIPIPVKYFMPIIDFALHPNGTTIHHI